MYKALRDQVQFYISNISNDRYLQFKYEVNDRKIPLETLVKFNKIKEITTNVNTLQRALRITTDYIQVDLEYSDNFTARTIYVENFPRRFERDDLRSLFSSIGEVSYVQMDFIEKTNKGYAFIEFQDPSSAVAALEYNGKQEITEWPDKLSDKTAQELLPLLSNNMRIMSKARWLELMKEYKEYKLLKTFEQKQRHQLANNKDVDFTPGLLVRVKNVKGNKGVIRELLKRSGVDCKFIQNDMVVRYGSKQEADTVLAYFANKRVVQQSEGDTMGDEGEGERVVIERLSREEEFQAWKEIMRQKSEYNKNKASKK